MLKICILMFLMKDIDYMKLGLENLHILLSCIRINYEESNISKKRTFFLLCCKNIV
jgi:hypothetical protein